MSVKYFRPLSIFLSLVTLAPAKMHIESDVSYLGESRNEKLDVYLPGEEFLEPHPAVLLIHGGGWRNGDKAEKRTASIAASLAENGYAVFSINYLLNEGTRDANNKLILTKVAWPRSFYDCKSALRFIREKADQYRVDPLRIGVMGCSAGGHLAMMLAVTANHVESNEHGLYTAQSNSVACVVNFYGIPDLRGQRLTPFTGSEWAGDTPTEEAASPVAYLDRHSPPFLIVHGSEDNVIPVEASRSLASFMKRKGLEHQFLEINGAGHSFDMQPKQMDLQAGVFDFLKTHLGSPKRQICQEN